jgi:hypothetical protein
MLDGANDRNGKHPEAVMQAQQGDILIIDSKTVGRPARHGTILEVHEPHGQPPYRVRWDDGHEALIFPGADAHLTARSPTAP